LKKWFIIAGILMIVGIAVFLSVMAHFDWDFRKLSNVVYVNKTYEITEAFESIDIDVNVTDIKFVVADDDKCTINCYETEKYFHQTSVNDGVLKIKMTDNRSLVDYLTPSFSDLEMTVYLPESAYDKLTVKTDTGSVFVPKDFSFRSVEIEGDTSSISVEAQISHFVKLESDTGEIKLSDVKPETIDISTDTGDIFIKNVEAKETVDIESDTGTVEITDLKCENFSAQTDTGEVILKNVVASKNMNIETDTGDVELDYCDGKEINIKSATGDITGTLQTKKIFYCKSASGDISVPESFEGGKCTVKTSSGDIVLKIA